MGALTAVAAAALAVAPALSASASPGRSAAAKREIARAYGGYVRALSLGHGRSVCRRLTASGRAELMDAAGLWSPWRGTCPEAVAKLRGVIREPSTLHDVRIFGTLASARLRSGDYRFFVRAGRKWKVAATASVNPLVEPAPPPRAKPATIFGISWSDVKRRADDGAAWAEDASRWRWFAPVLAAALVALVLLIALRARLYRRQTVALARSLEELTVRAHRLTSAPLGAGADSTLRDDLATLMRINKELVARLDAVQTRSEDVTRRLMDELARTDADTEQTARLEQRLARSETARAEAQAEIQALQDHVRRLRERVQLPD
jgi:hypothetical protein